MAENVETSIDKKQSLSAVVIDQWEDVPKVTIIAKELYPTCEKLSVVSTTIEAFVSKWDNFLVVTPSLGVSLNLMDPHQTLSRGS
jgi:hypothetical protein